METYEEVIRRNEPKNYTVSWTNVAGKKEKATYFPSWEEADIFAEGLRNVSGAQNVLVLRSGRHPNAKRWDATQNKRNASHKRVNHEMVLNEEVWTVPEGYVDGDADKHGPVEMPSLINRIPARTNKEKADWAKSNEWNDRTCLWQ